MLRDPSVYAMAEDIIGNGGSMGHYIGLGEAVGDQSRVLDAPISETAIVASAVGAALAGMRPVIDMRFSNCLPVCMDELTNQAAKSRYMFGGQGKVHMVVRCPDGILKMQGAHHTDCLEAWFAHMPGLQVVIPPALPRARACSRLPFATTIRSCSLSIRRSSKWRARCRTKSTPFPSVRHVSPVRGRTSA
ncbi:MAG: hypothetical protein ACLRX4_14875 [Oscillospiraceae bacterium]